MKEEKTELRVLKDNVLLIPRGQEKTNSGIIIPETSQEHQVKNVLFVSTVGPDVVNKDILTEGTCVVIPRHTGKWVPFEGFKYVLVKESDIIAIMDEVKMVPPNNEGGNK